MKGGLAKLISFVDYYYPVSLNLEGASAIIFYFTVYSLFGWLLENFYSLFTGREFFKPNFFLGPLKPMYGFAPLLLVFLITPETNWAVVIMLCFFIPTAVEYVSGALLQKFFNRQWWDYSDMPMQLQGHICLPFSLCWILLSLLCLKWIHPAIVSLYGTVEPIWGWIWPAVGLYLLAELALAIRRHSLHALATTNPTNPIQ
jgi:uncharacterized membrane protein